MNAFRTIGMPGVYYIKPEHMFKDLSNKTGDIVISRNMAGSCTRLWIKEKNLS